MDRKIKNSARLLMFLYIACLCYLCFWHFKTLPTVRDICGIGADKIVHFVMFLPFPILSFFSMGIMPRKWWSKTFYSITTYIVGCIVAAGTEIGQSYTMYRVCDIDDFQADALALAVSTVFVFIMMLVKNNRCREEV